MNPAASSDVVNTAVSSNNPINPNAGDQVMFFRDVSLGLSESKLRFHLIHFWEAQNPYTKVLIGQEMLLIDEEEMIYFHKLVKRCMLNGLLGANAQKRKRHYRDALIENVTSKLHAHTRDHPQEPETSELYSNMSFLV